MPLTPSSINPITGQKEGIVLILSAPSGTGKTTICHQLMKKLPEVRITISHTTRSPRKDEIDGEDYYFISEKEFQTMRERGDFLEYANINGNHYGTTFESIKKSRENGHDVLMELDVQGAQSLHKLKYPGVFIFFLPPSLEELTFRLKNRDTETKEKIKQRIDRGIEEIKGCMAYDYIITNYKVDESVDKFISIFRAEKLKASRFVPTSADIQALLNSQEKD